MITLTTEQAARQLLEVAEGIQHGTDWNNGTHAKIYRPKFPEAITALREALDHSADSGKPIDGQAKKAIFFSKCPKCKYAVSSMDAGAVWWCPSCKTEWPFGYEVPVKPEHDGHWSDCSVHNEPAYPNGPYDCGGYPPKPWRCACGANLYIDSNGAPVSKAEPAEQPVSQEYQDHLVNQSFDWAAMAAKHQFMEGYLIGLAEMREKCAVICEAKQSYSAMHANTEFAAVIRAINFEGDTGFRPVSEMIAEHKQDPKKAAAIEKAKMRKAEQEPVAWAHPSGGYLSARYMKEFATGLEKETYTIPLYAAPVSIAKQSETDSSSSLMRTTVRTKDLTDDEIDGIANNHDDFAGRIKVDHVFDFARAIIATDREKNNANNNS